MTYAVELIRKSTGEVAGRYAPQHVGGDSLQACRDFVAANAPLLKQTQMRVVKCK